MKLTQSILDFVPEGYTLRDVQVNALNWIESNWNTNDVFVLEAPTASGKSLISQTIMRWQANKNFESALIVPNKLLQDQITRDYPELPVLKGMENYICCTHPDLTCHQVKELSSNNSYCCSNCTYKLLRDRCRNEKQAAFNYYTYFANRIYKHNLIVDEAHKLTSLLCELGSISLDIKYHNIPKNLPALGDVVCYLENVLEVQNRAYNAATKLTTRAKIGNLRNKLSMVLQNITMASHDHFYEYITKKDGTTKLVIRPLTAKLLPPRLWPESVVKKIILLSATINEQDVENLGLGNYKAAYFKGTSPIPIENRPTIINPVASMSYKFQDRSVPKMAAYIRKLSDEHREEKGIIHTPYSVALKLKPYLTSERFLWYSQENKMKVFEEYKETTEPLILIAPGMAEGIDLIGDLGRWQVITKIQYPSLGDNYIKALLDKSRELYSWMTVRTVLQQIGRISRTPDDYGVTYILDSAFIKLYRHNKEMFPDWVKETFDWRL